MLSIWGGTYGGTIPGIPNGFGLAVSSTQRENNKITVSREHFPRTLWWLAHVPSVLRLSSENIPLA